MKTLNELDIVSKIKRENLDEKSYLKTLIEEAYKEIQEELFPQNKELQKYIEKNLKTIVDIMANFTSNSTNFS